MKLKKNAQTVLVFGNEYTLTRITGVMDSEELNGKVYSCDAKPGIFLQENNFISVETYIYIMKQVEASLKSETERVRNVMKIQEKRIVELVNENKELRKEDCVNKSKIGNLNKKICQKHQEISKIKNNILNTVKHLTTDIEAL
ncbi:MAG: hypothetical protein RR744_00250 [Cellulosilyticaceae bacterium]